MDKKPDFRKDYCTRCLGKEPIRNDNDIQDVRALYKEAVRLNKASGSITKDEADRLSDKCNNCYIARRKVYEEYKPDLNSPMARELKKELGTIFTKMIESKMVENPYCNKCDSIDTIKKEFITPIMNDLASYLDGLAEEGALTKEDAEMYKSNCRKCYQKRAEDSKKNQVNGFEDLCIQDPFKGE
jgi:hypothetical protein